MINWKMFFLVIGLIFILYCFLGFLIGGEAGPESWGYVMSHSIWSWVVSILLLVIGILIKN